jgi:hypothetical protein
MTPGDRCDRVLALIDDVLDANWSTVDGTSVDDALVDPTATSDPSRGQ